MSKQIIITGSGGILGSTLLQQLSTASDYSIYAVTSQVERLREEYSANKNVFVYTSVDELPILHEAIAINCAFPRVNKGKELATAFDFTEKLIEQLANKATHFINISSQSVYAQAGKEIQREISEVAPGNLYGMTKLAIESLVRLKTAQYNMKYVNIRLGSLASPTFDQRMINRFFQKIVDKEPITVDTGTPKVSYLHVTDAANALTQLIQAIVEEQEIATLYNLANNDWMTIKELVENCLSTAEKHGLTPSELIVSENSSEYNNVVNSDLFYRDMNWSPRYSMEKLIQTIFDTKLDELK